MNLKEKLLFRQVDIASLVFFRVVFGILGFADVLGSWLFYGLKKKAYALDQFRFTYYGFEWVQPFPEPFMSGFFILLAASALGVALGWHYRRCALFFAIGFTYVFLLEKAHYLNHGYLFCWISWLMVFLPANRSFSVDVWRRPKLFRSSAPYWSLFILQFLMGVVYFYGGLAKLNADWLQAMPLKIWLRSKTDVPLIGSLLQQEWAAWFMSYGGLMLDLLIVPMLIIRFTRPWAFMAAIFFHTTNHLVFSIGIFPYLSLALTALYFPPDFPRRISARLQARWNWLRKVAEIWAARMPSGQDLSPIRQESPRWRKGITTGLLIIILFHLLIPFRHRLYDGDVAWTEEGHRYSWRMMLRSKQGRGYFTVYFPGSDSRVEINPGEYLYNKQERKLYTHPDMILQFAHFLRDEHGGKGAVEVYADIKVRLNGGKYRQYIDPDVDLAKVEWSFFRKSDWILSRQND